MSSAALLLLAAWLAQLQAHAQNGVEPPAFPTSQSETGTLHMPGAAKQIVREERARQKALMSGSKSMGSPFIHQDMWQRWVSSGRWNNSTAQTIQNVVHNDEAAAGTRPMPPFTVPGVEKGEWFQYSLFQGGVFMEGLPPATQLDMLPRFATKPVGRSVLRADVEGAQTFLGVMPELAMPLVWNVLLPDYSDAETVYLPALDRWALPGEKWPVGSSIHSSMKMRTEAWLRSGLAEDFRVLTQGAQEAHHADKLLLPPFMFRGDVP